MLRSLDRVDDQAKLVCANYNLVRIAALEAAWMPVTTSNVSDIQSLNLPEQHFDPLLTNESLLAANNRGRKRIFFDYFSSPVDWCKVCNISTTMVPVAMILRPP